MLNYALLSKAINKLDSKKQQKKPKVDAAFFIENVSMQYNTVEKYFTDYNSLLENGEIMMKANDLDSFDCPFTLSEILEKL